MRFSLVMVVLVAACDGEAVTSLDAAAPRLSLDVVVTPSLLMVRTNGSDQVCDCDDEIMHFAAIGTCLDIDDVIECRCEPASCLSVKVTGDGVAPPSGTPVLQTRFELPSPFPPNLVMELSGCGHAATTIPIEPFVAPVPTLTVDAGNEQITAHWQTDVPAASAYATFGYGIWAKECHTTAQDATIAVPGVPAADYRSVGVTAFLPMVEHTTPEHEVRIWRGVDTLVDNPML